MKLSDNTIVYSLKKSFKYLPNSFKRRSIFLFIGILINSAFDLIGIAAVLPLIATILKDGFIQSNKILSSIYNLFGFESEALFIFFLSCMILSVILVKNIFGLISNKCF